MTLIFDKIKKSKKTVIALGVPLFFIVLILIKIVHTVKSSRNDPFGARGGMVFTEEQFMQDFSEGLPLEQAIYAVVWVRKKTNILDRITERKAIHKENSKYQWFGIGVRDELSKNWIVTFRENFVTPKLICETRVNIETGIVSELNCNLSEKDTYK